MRILMVASEVFGLVKTGGLADVVGALPRALSQQGHDVRILLPAYRGLLDTVAERGRPMPLGDLIGCGEVWLHPGRLPNTNTAVWLLQCDSLYERGGGPYLDAYGYDWPDNHLRFGLLSRAAALLSIAGPALGWAPDVIHAHDWQAGLVPAYLRVFGAHRPATVLTVHNLAFRGLFDPGVMPSLRLPWSMLHMYGMEFQGAASFLKGGLYYADRITTVSPTYAEEITWQDRGEGLQGLLGTRRPHLYGILNGIDEKVWDPATDPNLPVRYSAEDLSGKVRNKLALQKAMGLVEDPNIPLFGLVSRLTGQKGIDLILGNLEFLLGRGAQLVVLGSGEGPYEIALSAASRYHPDSIGFKRGYDEPLSHRIIAGSDFILVPSRFEPCGLTQMYAMRYGTIPIVRVTGGLADTVTDADADAEQGTGFRFYDASTWWLGNTIHRALSWWGTDRLTALQKRVMRRLYGWQRSADAYVQVYQAAIANPAHMP